MHVLVASNQAPALVSSLLSAMPQEHERGLGGWQSDGPPANPIRIPMSASAAMAELSERLEVDTAKMKSNLQSTREVVFSERLATSLIPQLGLGSPELVSDLVAKSAQENVSLNWPLKTQPFNPPSTQLAWKRILYRTEPRI